MLVHLSITCLRLQFLAPHVHAFPDHDVQVHDYDAAVQKSISITESDTSVSALIKRSSATASAVVAKGAFILQRQIALIRCSQC